MNRNDFQARESSGQPNRRMFLNQFGLGLGSVALAQMLRPEVLCANPTDRSAKQTHNRARAKRVIFLFQAGAPSQMDLFDYKPRLNKEHGKQLPESVRQGQRLTGMSGNQSSLPLVGSPFKFKQHGSCGAWISELLPYTAEIADDLCFIKSMHTEAINHGPAVTYLQTGSQIPGRPSMGAWIDYGLARINDNLPSFVVLVTRNKGGQPLFARLWGSGFLPSKYQGVRLRADKNPVLYLENPNGISRENRRAMIDALDELHQIKLKQTADPVVEAKLAQYEMAFRMQASIPEVADVSNEPESILNEYGPDVRTPGTFAANCLLARRLAERGVRFVQLYHQGWDHHSNLPGGIRTQCRETDQPTAALIGDLKRRGMLDDTLVVWGGEFGRTNYCQGKLTANNFGRDHHPRCFTIWMAGGGVKPGFSFGQTDPYSYNIVKDPVHIHDFQATLLHLLGMDHERLTYKYQGRHFRLTDVHGNVVDEIVA